MSLLPTTRNIQKQGKKGQLEFGGDQMLLFNTPNQCLKDGNFFFFFFCLIILHPLWIQGTFLADGEATLRSSTKHSLASLSLLQPAREKLNGGCHLHRVSGLKDDLGALPG